MNRRELLKIFPPILYNNLKKDASFNKILEELFVIEIAYLPK